MEKLCIPRPLKPGDCVALIAPSGPVPDGRMEETLAAVRAFGLRPKAYPTTAMRRGYLAGEDSARARDMNAAFADPEVAGVLCVRGGYGAQRLYSLIDWEAIARSPKRFLGYSDVTFAHIVLNQRCGMRTYHAPMPSTEWYSGLDAYTESWLRRALFGGPWGELTNCDGVERCTVAGGCARGALAGGNLSLVASALGTPYALDCRDKILFLEDVGEAPYRVDGMLNHLVASGSLQGCRGVVLGAFTNCGPRPDKPSLTLEQVFDDLLRPLGIPVLAGLSCGHSEPTLSLPLGAEVELDADAKTLRVLEEEA